MPRFDPMKARGTKGNSMGRAQIIRVSDRVYCAINYAISNVLYVITGKSVVVIDTTESMAAARVSFDEFRKICSLPVSHIIYTHFHGDHVRGAKVFHTSSAQVIAQKRMPEEMANVNRMLPYRRRVTALQFGFHLKPERRGVTLLNEPESGYVPPGVLVDEKYEFKEGNLTFQLYHTQGETVDHLMVWIPEERALFPGDLYYSSFPMLSNPMRPDRPVLAWAESLERMRSFRPQYLVPSHSKPLSGSERIDSVLANYARAIRFVHDETVKRINQGWPLEEIRRQVKLPNDLARLPYLQEHYGKVEWSVNGIFRQYTGWYSFNPTDLNPGPRLALCRAVFESTGGPEPLVKRARRALREGENQLVLELTDVVLAARPQHLAARAIRRKALQRLGAASENGVEQNIYRTAVKTAIAGMPDVLWWTSSQPRKFEYAGMWIRPNQDLPVNDEQISAPVKTDWARQLTSTADVQLLQTRTVAVINRWYDKSMYSAAVRQRYGGSGFRNFGYWKADTGTRPEACENLMETLLNFIPQRTGTILDVACGMGATTRHLQNYYPAKDITGVNISEKQINDCRVNAPGCNFHVMSATSLKFAAGTFDNVICVEAAFHFVTREVFFQEAYRVLKPGGRLVLSDILPTVPEETSRAPAHSVIGPSEYCNLYFRAGFERVEVLDATFECSTSFRMHILELHRRKFWTGEIDRMTFRNRRARILANHRSFGYYLLVCAQKGESK
jgi:glyoxylase-like metal-dependent hydrolase (beta-lactamase superfamily II)/SAM-dependent methyltransferase